MLFYTQIKREFTNASWRRGQTYFRDNRVTDVKLDGDLVQGKVRGSEPRAYETAITMGRGTIFSSKCNCPAHRLYETHCKHVAALAIWIVERGSLLRSGVTGAGKFGVAAREGGGGEFVLRQPQKAASDPRLRKLLISHPALGYARFTIRRDQMAGWLDGKDLHGSAFSVPVTFQEIAALLRYARQDLPLAAARGAANARRSAGTIEGQAVLFVRGMFQNRALAAISVESAIRYAEPDSGTIQIHALSYLTKLAEPGLWKTSQGLFLRVPTPEQLPDNEVNFIHRLDTQKIFYNDQAALENLAALLTHRYRDQIAFDQAVNVPVESVPLKLVTLVIGGKQGSARGLSYEFQGLTERFTSEELEQLAQQGKLSDHYVWKGDRIYRFETPLTRIRQLSTTAGESEGGSVTAKGSIEDDEKTPLHPLAAFRLSLELGVENFNVDPDWKEFHEWKKEFEKARVPALPKAEYGFELRDYQKNGLSWLWSLYHRGLSALLADEMGLGKTHQVLAFLTSLYGAAKGKPKHPSLVVAPTSVIAAWQQKLKKYDTGLKWYVFHGAGRSMPSGKVDLVLTTYGILHREEALRAMTWHTIILDEAQAIKNPSTISSRAARALQGRYRIAMTGTPVENQATDLWSLMEFLIPGYLGTLARFKRLYGGGRDATSELQAAALKRLVMPFLLRRTKVRVLSELPEKTEEIVSCEMTAEQKSAYTACLNSADAERVRASLQGEGKVDYANVFALLTRLKQICDHPRLTELTSGAAKPQAIDPALAGKWDTVQELLEEALGSGLKVVVFSQYLGMLDLLGHALRLGGIGYAEIRGDTVDRAAPLERFAQDSECRVFLCSLLAGGLGIDLTSASVCIHYDRWWNPAKENQATDRLHRFGQTRGVQVFKLQTPGTVEDRIARIIDSKVALSGALIEESSAGLKTFSRKELLDLLSP